MSKDDNKQIKINKIRAEKQKYPSYQPKMEKLQLKLNRAAVDGDMKGVGHYNVLINKIWDKNYLKKHKKDDK